MHIFKFQTDEFELQAHLLKFSFIYLTILITFLLASDGGGVGGILKKGRKLNLFS